MKTVARGACFFNPSSGWGKKNAVEEVKSAVEEAGIDYIPLSPALDIFKEIRGRMDRGQNLFIAAGGDGTINHVVQPLVNSEATLAILPLGTYNHFARDLAIPLDWRAALEVAVHGDLRQVDAARANDRFFVNNITLGLYPEVVTHREKFRGRGKVRAYWYALTTTLRNPKHISLVIDAGHHLRTIKTHLFMVSVNPYDLARVGFEAARPSVDGGELAAVWFPEMPMVRFIRVVARYLTGRISAEDGLHTLRTRQLRVTSRHHIRLGMDGEVFSMQSPLVVTIAPCSLNVKVPRMDKTV